MPRIGRLFAIGLVAFTTLLVGLVAHWAMPGLPWAAFVAASVGLFHWQMKLSCLDAFYFVVTTITTVGYGETHPLSDPGRAFTIFLLVTGVGSMGAAAVRGVSMALLIWPSSLCLRPVP